MQHRSSRQWQKGDIGGTITRIRCIIAGTAAGSFRASISSNYALTGWLTESKHTHGLNVMATVPPSGLVLVTGANGYVAGVLIQLLLDAGYRVRGTVRDSAKYAWMQDHYGLNFSLVTVSEMAVDGAFDEAIKGVDGIAHVASSVHLDPNPHTGIPPYIKSAVGILVSAAKEPSVKSVVYTSTQGTMVDTTPPGVPYDVGPDSWFLDAKKAWTLPPSNDFSRMLLNYSCGKLEAEQACWEWVKTNKPQFGFNTVLPCVNFGPVASPLHTGFHSSCGLLKMLWEGNTTPPTLIPPQFYVDVADTGLLHIAALTLSDVNHERILAIADRFTYNEILGIFRKYVPEHQFLSHIEEIPGTGTVDVVRAREIMAKMGKEFTTLDKAIQKWISQRLEVDKKNIMLIDTILDKV